MSLKNNTVPESVGTVEATEEKGSVKKLIRRGRPPLTPELYVEFDSKQYNITDLVERAKADYRLSHKVGVQSCKIYIKPEDGMAYYVINKFEGHLPL